MLTKLHGHACLIGQLGCENRPKRPKNLIFNPKLNFGTIFLRNALIDDLAFLLNMSIFIAY